MLRLILKQEGTIMDMLMPFILGWWGTHWFNRWHQMEIDKPPPGNPWGSVIAGILGGIGAVGILRLTGAPADPISGVFTALASGAVVAHLVMGAWRGMTAKG